MFHLIAVSEVLACASAGASTLYLTWRGAAHKPWLTIIPRDDGSDLANLQHLHGYNEHTYVLDSDEGMVWTDRGRGAVCYVERGAVWLVTGEPLAADNNLCDVTQKFVAHARENRKLVVFLPASERFANAMAGRGFRIHKIASSPYFDLRKWNPRGNSAKGLRLGVNRARRAGISVSAITDISAHFRQEVDELCETWLDSRAAGMSFGWLFRLAPFHNANAKRYFAARDPHGQLVGLLAASPIPARDGWYLEDVLRSTDSPDGTSELLVSEALRQLGANGARLGTLGTVPLSDIGMDEITSKAYLLSLALRLIRKNLKPIYNIEGLRCFKSKFVPCWWESEYVVVSHGFLRAPRTGIAVLRVIFGEGLQNIPSLFSYMKKVIRPHRSSAPKTACAKPDVVMETAGEISLNKKRFSVVKPS